jgi:PIN domain nuclease of toxin-antitoxin system
VENPIDRLIVAAARVLGASLISVDEALDGYDVARIWD